MNAPDHPADDRGAAAEAPAPDDLLAVAGGTAPAETDEPSRNRAAAALRRLGHALVGRDVPAEVLERIAAVAEDHAAEADACPVRHRPVEALKRRLWEHAPPDGAAMSHFDECVVSGQANPLGIAMRVRRDGDEAVARVRLGAAFEGAPQRAHGGVVAALFDDAMGYVLVIHRLPAFTGRLTVDYRAPVPVGVDVEIRARLRGREGRKLFLEATMSRLDGADGEPQTLCHGEGVFVEIPPERLGLPVPR